MGGAAQLLGETGMIGWLRSHWDRFRGAGEEAVTVPPMDGALRPDQRLETAPLRARIARPDNLVSLGGQILCSSGAEILRLDPESGGATPFLSLPAEVTALAASDDGRLAIGIESGGVLLRDRAGGLSALEERALSCPVALLWGGETLFIANGSAAAHPSDWKRDLMRRGASGSLHEWKGGRLTLLQEGLAWPYGLAMTPEGLVWSESWRHRLCLRGTDGRIRTMLGDLPGYPARLSPAAQGGFWLSLFAPRSQLVEFILREPVFRDRMIAEIDAAHWAAPSLTPSHTFLEPLQGGAQKHLGQLKPWAPTRSYGLVLRLDAQFHPVESFHSRADGARHGVTSVLGMEEGRALAAAKGGDVIVELVEEVLP